MPYLHQVLLIVQFNKFDSVMNKLSPAAPPLPQTLVEFISSHCAARPPPIQTTTFSFELQVVPPLWWPTTVVVPQAVTRQMKTPPATYHLWRRKGVV